MLQLIQKKARKLIYKIDQRRVKNNRGPHSIVFGTALQERGKPVYDDTAFLISMTFADKTLSGFNTLANLQIQQILKGQNEVVLRWRESALDSLICTDARKQEALGTSSC